MRYDYRIGAGISTLRLLEIGSALVLIGLLFGCASAGATYQSGVGDAYFERPPYSAGVRPAADVAIVHLPVRYQRGAVQPELFDPPAAPGGVVERLVAALNGHLDSLRAMPAAAGGAPHGTAPDVKFGCERAPDDECENLDFRVPHRLAVGRPSREWAESADALLASASADYLLVITLEVGNYLPRQRNWRGEKEILLGRDHAQDVRWLTALDRPTSVLQLTGALVDRNGRALRIAAEGLTARTTGIVAGGFGAQALIREADVEALLDARRGDLPDTPLVWQAALRNLLAELVGPGAVAAR